MKTLNLNLKRKWFDMIVSGEKKEEYREIKPYIISLLTQEGKKKDVKELASISPNLYRNIIEKYIKQFDTITFSNGYRKDRRQFVIELKGVKVRQGLEEWGAEKGKLYYVIELGDVIKKNF